MPENREIEEQLRRLQAAQDAVQRQLDELGQMTERTRALLDGQREPLDKADAGTSTGSAPPAAKRVETTASIPGQEAR